MDGSAEGLDIQLLSDLHLEINVDSSYLSDPTPEQQEEILKNLLDDQRHPQFEVKAPYLALLGDIGYPWTWVYKTFLGQQAARFETVFVLPGNHEFYSTNKYKPTHDQVLEHLREVCSLYPNVVLLVKDTLLFKGFRVIGTTLWERPSAHCNDTSKIYVAEKTLLPAQTQQEWYQSGFTFIKEELGKAKTAQEPAIVFTHHQGPFMTSFYQDYEGTLITWLYGHTHDSNCSRKGKTFIASNQLGYLQLGHTDKDFYSEFVVRVTPKEADVKIATNEHQMRKKAEEEKKNAELATKLANFVPPPPPPMLPGGKNLVKK